MNNITVAAMVLAYNTFIVAGTTWLVWHGWSGWWFLLAVMFMADVKDEKQ